MWRNQKKSTTAMTISDAVAVSVTIAALILVLLYFNIVQEMAQTMNDKGNNVYWNVALLMLLVEDSRRSNNDGVGDHQLNLCHPHLPAVL